MNFRTSHITEPPSIREQPIYLFLHCSFLVPKGYYKLRQFAIGRLPEKQAESLEVLRMDAAVRI